MDKIIEVDIVSVDDLYEKYNRKEVSADLINYIIERALKFDNQDNIKLVLNNKTKEDVVSLIKMSLNNEYSSSIVKFHRNNYVQSVYLVIGIIALFIYTIIKESIFREILLISGWVFICEMIELEILADSKNRRRKKAIKSLISSEIIEVKNK